MSSSLKKITSRWDTDTTTYQPTNPNPINSQLEAYINSVKPIDESVNLSATLEQTDTISPAVTVSETPTMPDFQSMTTREILEMATSGQAPLKRYDPVSGKEINYFLKMGDDPYSAMRDAEMIDVPDGVDPYVFRDNGYKDPALNDSVFGSNNTDNIFGSNNTDSVFGSADSVFGSNNTDSVFGSSDSVFGSNNTDNIFGQTDNQNSVFSAPTPENPVTKALSELFGSKPAYADTVNPTKITPLTEEELKKDFNEVWPLIRINEGFKGFPYKDSNCLDTAGTGHLMDLKNLEADPLIDFSDENKRNAYLDLSKRIEKEICSVGPNGRLGTNITANEQKERFNELTKYPINEAVDRENGLKFFRERIPQIQQALAIQNPAREWQDLAPEEKKVLIDILYNPGKNTPVFNYQEQKTYWPNLFDAIAKKDYPRAIENVSRNGVGKKRTERLKELLKSLIPPEQ